MPSYSRARWRKTSNPVPTVGGWALSYIGGGTIASGGYSRSSDSTDVMLDNPTPQFEKLSSAGFFVNTAMSKDVRTKVFVPGTASVWQSIWNGSLQKNTQQLAVTWPDVNESLTSSVGGSALLPSGVLAEIEAAKPLVITSAFSKAASPDAMSMVSIGELNETIALLREPVDLLRRRTEIFERLKRRYAKRHNQGLLGRELVSDMNDLWLKYRYGIMPLIYEIRGIVKALDAKLEKKRATARSTATLTGSWEAHSQTGPYYDFGDTTTSDLMGHWTCTIRAGVIHEYEDTLAGRFGLRVSDIPSSAWELLTLSFVADWIANVGDYIGALTFAARATAKASWVTMTYEANATTTCLNSMQGNHRPEAVMTQVGQASQSICTRKWVTRDPTSLADVKLGLRFEMNWKRWVDAFALISGRLKPTKGLRL